MALKVQWTSRAIESFDDIVEYIEENWSANSAKTFVQKTDNLLHEIAENPYMCQQMEGKDIKKGSITPQTSVYYQVMNDAVRLITFWDNRRNPKKLKL